MPEKYAEKATEHDDDDDIAITDSLSDMIDIDNRQIGLEEVA